MSSSPHQLAVLFDADAFVSPFGTAAGARS